jgi:dTDP-4-amino-4,6-dideoxygalactose transaminase
MIKFCDIQKWSSNSEVKAKVMQCLDEGRLSGGPGVQNLEKNIAAKFGYSSFSGVSSGTSALHLALLAINIKHGEMVAVPSLSFVASASVILMAGATPVFVDVYKDGNINLDSLELACKKYKIKAVIAVHLYGNPCDVNRLLMLSIKYKFKIIEDCAQAIGATVNGKAVGTFGDVGTVSFYATKNLPAGEGGGVICNSEQVFLDIQSRKNHGRTTHYDYDRLGFNYRMSDIFASILEVNLNNFDTDLIIRRQQASRYSECFSEMDIEYISQDTFGPSVFHQFVLIHEKRDKFIAALSDSGIGTSIVYPKLLHTTELFSDAIYVTSDVDRGWDGRIAKNCFSLPIGNHLSDLDMEYIIDQVIQISKRLA